MPNRHARNTVRYYILFTILLAFLFFSNDFGKIDVQKTAIVLAVGVDKENEDFVLTSQIAIPQSSTQGKSSQAVQLVSKGKTVADAFEEINAKTGWYPKLVFCRLILLGESAVQTNAFDTLDYFLRDEYLTDGCLVATCDGKAQTLLDTQALVDPSSSVAMAKVLSDHAKRTGTVLPNTLREFSIGYFGDSKSGFLPILKTTPQKEVQTPSENTKTQASDSSSSQQNQKEEKEKTVFTAEETALFVDGKRVERLNPKETFALSTILNELQLASYSVQTEKEICTLSVKKNSPKLRFKVGKDGRAQLKIQVDFTAGVTDYSISQPLDKTADAGDLTNGVFLSAEKTLTGEIATVFEKCKACGCDLFRLQERLVKYKNRNLHKYKDGILQNTSVEVKVRFKGVR